MRRVERWSNTHESAFFFASSSFFVGTQIGKAKPLWSPRRGRLYLLPCVAFYTWKKLASNSISFSPFSITAWWVFLIYGQFSDFCPRVCFETLPSPPSVSFPRSFTCINSWILFPLGRLKWQALSHAQTRRRKRKNFKLKRSPEMILLECVLWNWNSLETFFVWLPKTREREKEKLN